MSAVDEVALRDAVDHIAIDFHDEDYENCMRRCCALLFERGQPIDDHVSKALYVFVRDCCDNLLTRAEDARPGGTSCSFCGKAPPDVRLGAGRSAFICNECANAFSQILSEPTAS